MLHFYDRDLFWLGMWLSIALPMRQFGNGIRVFLAFLDRGIRPPKDHPVSLEESVAWRRVHHHPLYNHALVSMIICCRWCSAWRRDGLTLQTMAKLWLVGSRLDPLRLPRQLHVAPFVWHFHHSC